MANSYTQVPNYIMSLLYGSHLNGSEASVYAYIIRKTIGFHKASDKISYSQIANATGLSEMTAVRAVSSLEKKNLIKVKRKGKMINIISLPSNNSVRRTSNKNDAKPLTDLLDTKENQKQPSSGLLLRATIDGKENKEPIDEGEIDDEYTI